MLLYSPGIAIAPYIRINTILLWQEVYEHKKVIWQQLWIKTSKCLCELIFSWEPALWTLMSVDRVMMMRSLKIIVISNYNQWLLGIDMKTKVVQHVPRIIFMFSMFSSFQVPSACLTFRIFLFIFSLVCHYHIKLVIKLRIIGWKPLMP